MDGDWNRLEWVGSSREDVRSFPRPVRREIGRALYAAQLGFTDPAAKPLRGFSGRSVLAIVALHHGDTWRAVYTVRFAESIYVLHAFQKKSKKGIATPTKRWTWSASDCGRPRATSEGGQSEKEKENRSREGQR